jgi:AraC-like DNA-binding protein
MIQISHPLASVPPENVSTGPGADARFLRVGPFVNIALILRSLGIDPVPVFKQANFGLEQFRDPDLKLPYLQISQLLAASVNATGCEHFGLLLGQSASASHLGLAGFLMRAAPTVEAALDSLVEHLDLHDQGGTPTLIKTAEMTLLGYTVQQPGAVAVDHIYDMTTAITCNIMRALCGKTWCPSEVMLARRKPSDTEPYRHFFKAPVQFDAELSAIVFRNRCLQQPVPSADALLFDHLEKTASDLHAQQHLSLTNTLLAQLRLGLLRRQWSAADLASTLGLHERTLHRRLHAVGTSYRRELDKVRQSTSLQLLASTDISVAQIADSMGYTNSSAFIRAFSRWTGTTPMKWRREDNTL